MAFHISKNSGPSLDSPESLFNDLRSRKISGLFAHQADVLRQYMNNALSVEDVALQLPTGSGKTLVGLLLGEWRRRKYHERVVYLCPTNQLVNQVAAQAQNQYGIAVRAFTGPKADYLPEAKNDYLEAESIAVTAYSALFNTNPFFKNSHVILLDDAHSADNYISGAWSLRIERHRAQHAPLFAALAACLRDVLPSTDYSRLINPPDSTFDAAWVDKLPTTVLYQMRAELIGIIDAHVQDQKDLYNPWKWLRDRLLACHLFISTNEILVRPLIPPTNFHAPFAAAKQRVYMSATLGAGGDLERLSGRRAIMRLEVPAGWDKQGIGRRLFFFPERSLKSEDADAFVQSAMRRAGRSLVMVPDDTSAKQVRETVVRELAFPVFNAQEIEESKTPFTSQPQAVAVVSNRYDGIDFPKNECRLSIVEGLPRATNLQERFLIDRMGAGYLLDDRILTRLLQAFGRCTRDATDYAAVIIRGEALQTYLLLHEHREFMHPELQSELQFGISQSKNTLATEMLENFELFLAQGPEWHQADDAIVADRQSLSRKELPAATDLRGVVAFEVDYQNAMWVGDYVNALEAARKVLTGLKNGQLKASRALWNYLCGSSAYLARQAGSAIGDSASTTYFDAAKKGALSIQWLVKLSSPEASEVAQNTRDSRLSALIERLEVTLQELGTQQDSKYDRNEELIRKHLASNDGKVFEMGHERLGNLLGFQSGNKESSGAPDPWWIVDENLCFIFEDHAGASSDSSLDVTKARQAVTHPNWVRTHLPLAQNARIIAVLITPAKHADIDALPHLKEVYLWSLEEFRLWAHQALATIRELRREFPGTGDLFWRESAIRAYQEHGMDPQSILDHLLQNVAYDIMKPATP